jgi:hypothetical protein
METRIVEYDSFIRKPKGFGSSLQATGVSATDIDIGNIVPALRYPKTYALYVQFRIA